MKPKAQLKLGDLERPPDLSGNSLSTRRAPSVIIERARVDPGTIQALTELKRAPVGLKS